mmetsp:Transcript_5423/g.5842  ORF Transcript_5423/g.5842 Transcript_5423/m.5842 type:complete len:92 (-) Transcript_5423:52-327(-)
MFDSNPIPESVVESVVTKMKRIRPIKVKPTTKPIPFRVSNTLYGCLANDHDDDEEDDIESVVRTVDIKEAQRTSKAGKKEQQQQESRKESA